MSSNTNPTTAVKPQDTKTTTPMTGSNDASKKNPSDMGPDKKAAYQSTTAKDGTVVTPKNANDSDKDKVAGKDKETSGKTAAA